MNKAVGALALALGLTSILLGVALSYACTSGDLGAFGTVAEAVRRDACGGTIPSEGIYTCLEYGYRDVGVLLLILGGTVSAGGLVLLALPTKRPKVVSPHE